MLCIISSLSSYNSTTWNSSFKLRQISFINRTLLIWLFQSTEVESNEIIEAASVYLISIFPNLYLIHPLNLLSIFFSFLAYCRSHLLFFMSGGDFVYFCLSLFALGGSRSNISGPTFWQKMILLRNEWPSHQLLHRALLSRSTSESQNAEIREVHQHHMDQEAPSISKVQWWNSIFLLQSACQYLQKGVMSSQ